MSPKVWSLLVVLLPVPSVAQARLERPQLRASLRLAVGQSVTAALTFHLEPGWHLYWKNPGDSGLPLDVKWSLPAGWKASPLAFPVPTAFRAPDGVNYIHEGSVTFLATLTPPKEGPSADSPIRADLDWLVCKESCIADQGTLTTLLRSGPDRLSPMELRGARSRLPLPYHPGLQLGPASAQVSGNRVLVTLPLAGPAAEGAIAFFPEVPKGYSVLHAEVATTAESVLVPLLPSGSQSRLSRLKGILCLGTTAVAVDVPVRPPPKP